MGRPWAPGGTPGPERERRRGPRTWPRDHDLDEERARARPAAPGWREPTYGSGHREDRSGEREPWGPTREVELEGFVADDEELVAGRRPVEEAFAARREAHRLLVVPERRAALEAVVLHATTLRIPVVEVEGGTLTALSGFDGHQGVALVVAPRRHATLDEMLARARAREEPPFLLALDSLEDPQNLGTMLRSAEACGVHGVLFPTRRQAPLSPAAVKASAGAIEHLLLAPVDDLAGTLVELGGRGIRRVGADEEAALSYREADLRGPLVVVIGSEGHGLSGSIRRRLDLSVRIPMYGRVASLNAAVAGSILLFEIAGQRGAAAERAATGAGDEMTGTTGAEPLGAVTTVLPSQPARTRPRSRRRLTSSDAGPGDGGEAATTDSAGAQLDRAVEGADAAPPVEADAYDPRLEDAAPTAPKNADDDLLPGEGPPPSGAP